MSGILCATLGGFPNCLGSVTVTVGYFPLGTPPTNIDFWGFPNLGANPGSVSPATWADTGLTFTDFDYRYIYSNNTERLLYFVNGYAPNAGWTTLTVGTSSYSRTSAIYSYNGTETAWSWDASSTGNPFGTTIGATKVATWS